MFRVKKRDGTIVEFNREKIAQAIFKAASAVGGTDYVLAEKIAEEVERYLKTSYPRRKIINVEEIQDAVEKTLIELGHAKTAKAYILYREQHRKLRQTTQLIEEGINLIEQYIKQHDWRVNENSNMSYSLQGLNNYLAATISAQYWLEKIYPPEVSRAHKSGDIHIHDLSQISVYCCGWDLQDLLQQGFTGVPGKVESAPAKHFRTALGQIVNFFYTLQGEAAGAQAFSNFDTLLAPFVAYDKLEYHEVKQALQEFLFNINVPTRVGFQTPFTNITLDLTCPTSLRNENVIIGGKKMPETYAEFQREMDMINSAFAELMMAGDAKGRIFTFPIPTYNITKDFDWDNENLASLWQMTAKYGIPYFSNFINSDMDPNDARSMCCRLRLDNREIKRRSINLFNAVNGTELKRAEIRGGGLFGANPLTGSIGVVTINMARVGYRANDFSEFLKILKENMDIAKESLEIKRKILEKYTEVGLYPYSRFYLRDIKKNFGSYWANHFSTIGLIGMNEALLNLIGEGIYTEHGRELALETLNFMREQLNKYQDETGNLYNLEASPAEGASYRLARLDKKFFPDIISQGVDEPFYTNSTQLPVDYKPDLFEVLRLQDELQTKYTGGTVLHIFLGESIDDYNAVKNLVRKISENFKLPYFTLTPTFSVCPVHGYIPGKYEFCPFGHSPTELKRYGVKVNV